MQRPLPPSQDYNIRYLRDCANQSIVPAVSIRPPPNTRPLRFDCVPISSSPSHKAQPININPTELGKVIYNSLNQFRFITPRREAMAFHLKYMSPTAAQPATTPVTILADVPQDAGFGNEEWHGFLESLPKYEGYRWVFKEVGKRETPHQYGFGWFMDEIIEPVVKGPLVFARFDTNIYVDRYAMMKLIL